MARHIKIEFVALNSILAVIVLIVPSLAAAAYHEIYVTAQVHSTSTAENEASFLIPVNPSPALPSQCNTLVYILPADRHMLAAAVGARLSGYPIGIRYNDAAPVIQLGSWGGATTRCKVESIYNP